MNIFIYLFITHNVLYTLLTFRYEGEFFYNQMEGKGIYQWEDGRKFEGQWSAGEMEGYGIMKWPDGRIYKG